MHSSIRFIDVLLILIAFFAPWGEGAQWPADVDPAGIFAALAAVLIIYWLLAAEEKRVFPSSFALFTIFIFLHTLVTYGILFGQEMAPGYGGRHEMQHNLLRLVEAQGTTIARYFLLALFGFALAATARHAEQLAPFLLSYGAGLAAASLLGGYGLEDVRLEEIRMSGASLNPNAYGLSGITAIFLGIAALSLRAQKPFVRGLCALVIAAGIAAVFSSGSRSAIAGTLAGALIMLILIPGARRKLWLITAPPLIFIVVLNVCPGAFPDTLLRRFNYERIREDGGEGRLFIWKDYMNKLPEYALTGVGMGRSREAVKYSWTKKLAATHNSYLGVGVEFGAGGLFLFSLALYRLGKGILVRRFLETPPLPGTALFGLFAAWLIMSFFADTLALRETWIILGFAASYDYLGKGTRTCGCARLPACRIPEVQRR